MATAKKELQEIAQAQGIAPYGIRWSDVTTGQPPVQAKGLGYMGKIPNESGDSMTELSTTFEINGQSVAAPLIVPGLTDQEIQSLQQGSVPETVYAKAYDHALQRLSKGQDPFATGQDLRRYNGGGEVQPPMSDYVFPNRARDYTPPPKSTASVDLARMGKQAGLVGAGFLPGAGVADYFGQFPSMEGGTEPSAVENFQQGNYGTAALQGLGAMGDLAMTVPVVGTAVGSVMKVPRAAQKMLQELPKVDELGFYSQVEKAVMDNPQQKGTGAQFLAQIQKTPGVKAEELQYTGLDKFLAGKPTVTKAEIQDYLDTNKVQVQEVVLGGKQPFDQQRLLTLENEYANLKQHPIDDPSFGEEKYDEMIRLMNIRDQSTTDSLYNQAEASMRRGQRAQAAGDDASAGKYFKDYEMFNTRAEKLDLQDLGLMNPTKFSSYTLPGGQNYREVLLTLPAAPRAKTVDEAFELWKQDARAGKRGQYSAEEINSMQVDNVFDILKDEYMTPLAQDVYRSLHFDQPNILAHMRLNDRVVDGKNTLFIEEIQSDWHKAGRKKGYETGLEKTPADLEKELTVVTTKRSRLIEEAADLPDSQMDQFKIMNEEIKRLGEEATRLNNEWTNSLNRPKGVPDAPFKTSWNELTLKRAIKLASDEGYDQIAFTTGKTQADRYALRRSVDSIDVRGFGDNRRIVQINGKEGRPFQLQVNNDGIVETSMYAKQFEGKALDKIVGKDIAKQLMDATDNKSFSGLDLDVGGEGMKGFYDKMLPKKLEKLSKRYGAKVEKTTMDTPDGPVEIWAMQLPDELKETVSTQGQPLFQLGAGAVGTAGIMSLTGEDAQAAQEP
jgi:hypothetical protein